MHILDGVLAADSGEILLDGEVLRLRSPRQARAVGIGMVHQHFTLVDAMTVAENLALSIPADSPAGRRSIRLDRVAVARQAQAFAEGIGMQLPPPDARVRELSVGARQRLEILKASMAAGRVLILDEPTAVLTPGEVEPLIALLRTLRSQGRLILFITHKLREVEDVADRVTILRQGRVVATHRVADVEMATLAEEMIGAKLAPGRSDGSRSVDAPARLRLSNVSVSDDEGRPVLRGVEMAVVAGEILGIAGVDGNGQRELFEVVTGLRPASHGAVDVGQDPGAALTPARARAAGVACIPPDRQREGLALRMSVADNFLLSASVLDRYTQGGLLAPDPARDFAAAAARDYGLRFAGLDQVARGLSGGNQQRIVVARELSQRPRVVIAVNPTRGLDIQAARAVGAALRAAAAGGAAILLISTDLDELLELSARISVLFRGELRPALMPPFDVAEIGRRMAGGTVD